MGQVHQTFARGLIQLDGIALLDELAHDLTFVVLDDQHLFGLHHLLDHDGPQVGEHVGILVLAQGIIGEHARMRRADRRQATDAHSDVRMQFVHR